MAFAWCSWLASAALAIFITFLLSFRIIIQWFIQTNMYKAYFSFLQSYWEAVADTSGEIRANLVTKMIAKLSEDGGGDVLEIGISVGNNLKYLNLPPGCSYIGLDCNPNMESYLRENLKKYPNQNIPLKKFAVEDASNMASVEDGSVMAVLATQMFCSLEEEKIKDILKEIKRVLKTGGYFFFMEHIADEPGTVRRFFQNMSVIVGVPLFLDGCLFNKETWKYIESAGFKDVVYEKTVHPGFFDWRFPVLTVLCTMTQKKLHGYAVK